ncbi:MAG: ABC transporter permease [bacterium JZ-2024 1]
MNVLEAFRMGLIEISSHKLRSFLTMMGVVFGVAAVIAIISIGEGAKREAVKQLRELGTHTIRILPIRDETIVSTQMSGPGFSGTASAPAWTLKKFLTLGDIQTLEQFGEIIQALAVESVRERPTTVYYLSNRFDARIVGTTPGFPEAASHRVARGRFFTQEEVDMHSRVAVLGSEAKFRLFGPEDPIGKSLSINNVVFTVIGVMASKDTSGITLIKVRDLDKEVYIPITTDAFYGGFIDYRRQIVDEVIVKIHTRYDLKEAAELIKDRLLRLQNDETTFEIIIPEEVLRQQQALQRIFSIVMGFIAAISLFVGGIGIMNIMLATVVQRTREIGIRRAVGASRTDILLQFLVESVVISLSGGFLGIFVGFLLGKAITLYAGWSTIFSFSAVLVSFLVATLTGIIFGLYPAHQASRLHPVEALRYE